MAPSREQCELLAESMKARARILRVILDLRETVGKIVDAITKIRFGILPAEIAADIVNAIQAAAMTAARAALGAVSSIVASIIGLLLADLLKIILSAPAAIYAFVYFPQKLAIEAAERERIYILRASHNLDVIIRIISKWLGGVSGAKYYQQMVDALPHIRRAMAVADDMISQLDANPPAPGTRPSFVFDKGKYAELRSRVNSAIRITKPTSVIAGFLGVDRGIEVEKQRIVTAGMPRINAEFAQKNATAARTYQDGVSSVPAGAGRAAAIAVLSLSYGLERKKNVAWRKSAVAILEAKATIEANASIGKSIIDNGGSVIDAFTEDMRIIRKNVGLMKGNFNKAMRSYYESQALCNTIVDFEQLISSLVSQLIEFLSQNNKTGKVISRIIDSSSVLIKTTEASFTKAVEKYNNPDETIGPFELSGTVVVGHGLLISSDAMMQATITDELISLSNIAASMADADDKFKTFIDKVRNIPDWDGTTGVWAVSIIKAKIPPYLSWQYNDLLTAISPATSIDGESNAIRKISILMRRKVRELLRHNGIVLNALYSYTPTLSGEVNALMDKLEKLGLLGLFAKTLSFASLVNEVSSIMRPTSGSLTTSREACMAAYPDIDFDGKDVAAVQAKMLAMFNSITMFSEYVKSSEEGSEDRAGSNEMIRTTRFSDVESEPGVMKQPADRLS